MIRAHRDAAAPSADRLAHALRAFHGLHGLRGFLVIALVLSLTLAGCAPRDDRPESTEAEFRAEALGLPGVESIGPVTEPWDGMPPDAQEITLDTAATEDELRGTGDALYDMLQNRRYPDHAPSMVVRSGKFQGFYGANIHYSPQAFGKSTGVSANVLDLELLPYLHGLPDVESGTLGTTHPDEAPRASVEVDGPVHPWFEDRVASPHDVILTAVDARSAEGGATPEDPAQPSALGSDTASQDEQDRVTVDLSDRVAQDSFAQLAGALGQDAEILGGEFSGTPLQGAFTPSELVVGTATDAAADEIHKSVLALYGPDRLPSLEIRSSEGLTVSIDREGLSRAGAYFDAAKVFRAMGITVTSFDPGANTIALTVPDSRALLELADHVTTGDRPLPGDAVFMVQDPAMARAAAAQDPSTDALAPESTYAVRGTPERLSEIAPLTAALWDAGFLIEFFVEDYAGQDHGLELGVSEEQDLSSPDSRAALIGILREHGWDGTAHIRLDAGDAGFLRLESTATGPATGDLPEYDDPGGDPAGWMSDFIDEWNATAG